MKKLCFKNVLLSTKATITQKGLKTRSALQQCRTFYSTIITILLKCPKAVRIGLTLKIETIGLQIDRQFEITLHLLNLNSSNINLLLASFLFLIRVINVIEFRHPLWKQNTYLGLIFTDQLKLRVLLYLTIQAPFCFLRIFLHNEVWFSCMLNKVFCKQKVATKFCSNILLFVWLCSAFLLN